MVLPSTFTCKTSSLRIFLVSWSHCDAARSHSSHVGQVPCEVTLFPIVKPVTVFPQLAKEQRDVGIREVVLDVMLRLQLEMVTNPDNVVLDFAVPQWVYGIKVFNIVPCPVQQNCLAVK